MFFLFPFNKGKIAYVVIKFHGLLVSATVKYFEKGKAVRKRIKEAHKAINKALKIARKKKRTPGVMIGTALNALKGLSDEVEYTRKTLKATFDNMEEALKQIEKERIDEPAALIESARELFEKKDFTGGMELLRESKEKAGKKVLQRTRTALFCGISGDVKDLKREIERLGESDFFSRKICNPPAKQQLKPDPDPDQDLTVKAKAFGGTQSLSTPQAIIEPDNLSGS
jgi:hypothetical protein